MVKKKKGPFIQVPITVGSFFLIGSPNGEFRISDPSGNRKVESYCLSKQFWPDHLDFSFYKHDMVSRLSKINPEVYLAKLIWKNKKLNPVKSRGWIFWMFYKDAHSKKILKCQFFSKIIFFFLNYKIFF